MMKVHLFNSIALLSLFIILVLSVFFAATKKGEKAGNRIMAGILLLFALQIIFSFTVSNYAFTYFMNWHKLLFLIRQTGFLTGPFIFLYLQIYLTDRPLKLIDLFHCIPFAGILIFLGFYYLKTENFIMWNTSINVYDTILILIHNLFYVILSLVSFRTFNFSKTGIFKKIKLSPGVGWLQIVLIGFVILWIINLYSFASYMVLKKPVWCAQTGSIYALTLFLFLTSIMFILLLRPEVCLLIEKYKKSKINEADKNKYKLSLINYMNIRKPYLEPEISIEDMAKDLSINTRILSQIINQSFKKNFNGYMNEYRINEALQQLSDIRNKNTIQEILFDSGFNSVSVFYAEFKKYTGLTPQEYRTSRNN
jgi:AraC-like DNA-binding protein